MLVYYILYAVTLVSMAAVAVPQSMSTRQKLERNAYWLVCILLCGLLALRHPTMGADLAYGQSYGYLGQFAVIAKYKWSALYAFSKASHYEYGFILFNKLLSVFTESNQVYIAVTAIMSLVPILILLYRNSDHPFDSLLIYLGLPVFLICYSSVRQAIAVSVCTLSFEFLKKKKFWPFLLVVLFAAMFHRTAIVFAVVYPLYHLHIDKRVQTFSILLIPLVFLLREPIFHLVSGYFRQNAVIEQTSSYTLFVVFSLIYIFTVLFGNENDPEECGYRNLFLLVCLCQAFASIYSIAMRLGYYFMPYLPLLLDRVLQNFPHDHQRQMARWAVVGSFALFGLYSIYVSRGDWAHASPYIFFWQSAGGG